MDRRRKRSSRRLPARIEPRLVEDRIPGEPWLAICCAH